MSRMSKPLRILAITLFLGIVFFGLPALAQGTNPNHSKIPDPQTLGSMTNQLYSSLLNLQTFLSMLSYILGVFFSLTGLQKLRANVDDPGRNPLMPALMRLGAAAFFIFAPTFANILVDSISGAGVGGQENLVEFENADGMTPKTDGDGLDGALTRFVIDFATPFMENLLPFFSYVAGLIFMLIGLKRLALADGQGPQAPGGLGTIGTFVVSATLMAFGYIMYTLQGSLFGSTTLVSNPIFIGGTGTNSALLDRTNQAMWGVFIFLRIAGYISVLRGLFMLRAVGEGSGNVSMMAVGTHLIAGALLANGTAFVLAAQETFIEDPSKYILQ